MNDKPKVGVGFGVMLLNNRKQVLLGRKNTESDQGTWTMPGGNFEFGESFEDGAARKTREETSININIDKLKIISLSNDVTSNAHYVTVGFLSTDFSGEAKVMEPDEITNWKWFDLDTLPQPMFKPSQEVIDNFLVNKLYQK